MFRYEGSNTKSLQMCWSNFLKIRIADDWSALIFSHVPTHDITLPDYVVGHSGIFHTMIFGRLLVLLIILHDSFV